MKKPFLIEYKQAENADKIYYDLFPREWKTFKSYETETGRDQAMFIFKRKFMFLEFRAKDIPAGKSTQKP